MNPNSDKTAKTDIDAEAVIIEHDDISNYNPEQILPESPEVISKIRSWLNPTAYDIAGGEYRKHLASHVAGTGDWLTSGSHYQQWLNDDQHGILWIKGIPGSGKSVMAAKLIDELTKSNPGSPVLFFFFRQIIKANHKPEALLRDWMDQVLDYSPPLQQELKEHVEARRAITNKSISMEDMWKHLRMAFARLPGKVFCVADALDEMDHGNETFLQALVALGQWMPEKVKVLMTSRPVPTIEGPLRQFSGLELRLQEKLVDADISTYVKSTLSNSTIPEHRWLVIQDAVPGRANGLFLYARLAMDAFVEPGADVDAVLSKLPADLNVLYTDLLTEHSWRPGVPDSIQRLILQAVTHAARPLRLLELAELIKVSNPDGTGRDLKETKDLIRAACGPLLEILADETVSVIHHSFTEYLKGTTRDKDRSLGYPVLEMGPTHTQLAIACLRYLTHGCLDSSKVKEQEDDDDSSDNNWLGHNSGKGKTSKDEVQLRLKHPFFNYAARNWSFHINNSENAGQDQSEINAQLNKFLGDDATLKAWIRATWDKDNASPDGVTQFHIAAEQGLVSYVKELLQHMQADSCDDYGRTPLWWAAEMGHAAVVRVLLNAGGNPDKEDELYGLKPLHEAASKNHAEVVRALLEAGVDPMTPKTKENPGRRCGNAPRSVGHTPLMYSCQQGHLEAVDAFLPFLEMEAVQRALFWAAGSGRSKIVDRILQHPGVDVNAKIHGDTALYIACGSPNIAVIESLLEAGADPNVACYDSRDEFAGMGSVFYFEDESKRPTFNCLDQLCRSNGRRIYFPPEAYSDMEAIFSLLMGAEAKLHRTLLHKAVGSPVMTRLLLAAGADADATDSLGSVPLHSAGSIDAINLLIEEGNADVNVVRQDGQTPLLTLLGGRQPHVVMKLLEYGPDCNAVDEKGDGALHTALLNNADLDVIKELLKRGADPTHKNRDGLTPLLAMKETSLGLIDVLVAAGADLNAPDAVGATLLLRKLDRSNFLRTGFRDLENLMNRGASPLVRDCKGRTALHLAVHLHQTKSDSGQTPFDFLMSCDRGLDVMAVDFAGNTLLHELASLGENRESYLATPLIKFWKQLLDLGLDLEQVNYAGETPLQILCTRDTTIAHIRRGATMPIDFVLVQTKDLEKRDIHGATALHRAVNSGEEYAKKLLDAGANPVAATQEGLTPLHLAARSRDSNIVGLLLSKLRAKLSPQQFTTAINAASYGRRSSITPLFYACQSGRPETVALLLQAGATVKGQDLFSACLDFESEDALFQSVYQLAESTEHGAPYGIKLHDIRRRRTGGDPYRHLGRLNEHVTVRLEEILEALHLHGAHLYTDRHINEAITQKHAYTARAMIDLQDKQRAIEKGQNCMSEIKELFDIGRRSEKGLVTHALQSSDLLKTGHVRKDTFLSLLDQREYALIRDLAQAGLEFLPIAEHPVGDSRCPCNFSILVRYGFASLIESIGSVVMKRALTRGDWHAFRDNTKPGLFYAKRDLSEGEHMGKNPVPFLLDAVQRELPNMPVIEILMEKFGVDVNEMCYNVEYDHQLGEMRAVPAQTALHYVSQGKHWWHVFQALPYLLKAGADMESRTYEGRTPLHIALRSSDHWSGPYGKDASKILIDAGADVNAVNKKGRSCLAYAGDDVEMIKFLLSRGAIPSADSILAAIDAKSTVALEALLSSGANANVRQNKLPEEEPENKNDKKKRLDDMWALLDLLEADEVPKHEIYPLYHAGLLLNQNESKEEKISQDIEIENRLVEILLSHGADPFAKFLIPDQTDADKTESASTDEIPPGFRPGLVLHELFYQGKITDVFFRIPNLDVNFRDPKGRTLLHAACQSSCGPDYALGSGKEKARDDEEITTAFQQLLSMRANVRTQDQLGRNVLHHMIGNGIDIEYNNFNGFKTSMEQVLGQQPHLMDQEDTFGQTPLHFAVTRAAMRGRPDIAQTLLAAGAELKKVDKNGENVLHLLAKNLNPSGLCDFFEDLVNRGADIHARNSRGETPLFVFCRGFDIKHRHRYCSAEKDGNTEAISMFAKLGSDFAAVDKKGRGVLHAAASGSVARFKQIMAHGPDVMLEDENQQTAIDVAAACANLAILELFEKKE